MKRAERRIPNSRPKHAARLVVALALLASSHKEAVAQNACQQGETKQVSTQMGQAKEGAYTRQKFCKHKNSVYNPPPCWVIEDFDLDIAKYGNSSYSTNLVAAGSKFLSQQEWESEFKAAFELAASVDNSTLKSKLEATIEQMRKDYESHRTSIQSSHQSLQVNMEACGRGTFVQFGSLIEVTANIQLRCTGCKMVYRDTLRKALRVTIDEVKRNHRPTVTVNPWMNHDKPMMAHRNNVANLLRSTTDDIKHDSKTTPKWTPWLNRDRPSGAGDYETLRGFLKEGKACANPTKVECQTTAGQDWKASGQSYTCDTKDGGYCRNDEQANGGRCLDYRVRFLCP